MKKPNGSGARKNASWIKSFVDHTNNLESPEIFRRWAAIVTIGAILEQKVWFMTSSPLYPNIYVYLVGPPGVGKTRTIRAAKQYLAEVPEFFIAPTSMTPASLVDSLVSYKRTLIRLPGDPVEYNTMLIAADELSAFMHANDSQMIGLLTAFYDPDMYREERRGREVKTKIKSPQISILCGTTPSNLMTITPEYSWGQGFMSRMMLVYSDERIVTNIFEAQQVPLDQTLVYDLKLINSLFGQFSATSDYQKAVNNWRALKEEPIPTHPRLTHYCTRRLAHLLKLSMVSSADRGHSLLLTVDDFNQSMGWLLEMEALIPEVFKAATPGADSQAMDDIKHFVAALDKGRGVRENVIINFAREKLPLNTIKHVLDIMERSAILEVVGVKKDATRIWKAKTPKVEGE